MKLYTNRNQSRNLGSYFIQHMLAMTAEDLSSKSDIAAELAWRDSECDKLRAENDALLADAEKVTRQTALIALRRAQSAPTTSAPLATRRLPLSARPLQADPILPGPP